MSARKAKDRIEPLTLESQTGVGDSLEVYVCGDAFAECNGDVVHVRIENPWAGDTETGFGRDGSLYLSYGNVMALYEWLGRVIDQKESERSKP